MKLSYQGIQDKAGYAAAGVKLPGYDGPQTAAKTAEAPGWVHVGAGNNIRGVVAALQQKLLNDGLAEAGIIAAETFDYDIIEKIYAPHDSMTLMVTLNPDGSTDKEVIASIADGLKADCTNEKDWAALKAAFAKPPLQVASCTITEKGYAVTNLAGELMPVVVADIEHGPDHARHAMAVTAAMLYERYKAGAAPIAAVRAKAIELGMELVVESETLTPDGPTEAKVCIDWLKSVE